MKKTKFSEQQIAFVLKQAEINYMDNMSQNAAKKFSIFGFLQV